MQNNYIHRLLCFLIFCLLFIFSNACQSQKEIIKDNPSLQEAKTIYSKVEELQGNPKKNLLRKDWPETEDVLTKGYFVYPLVPYFPYVFYNTVAMYGKEFFFLPVSMVKGGSKLQDELDVWFIENSLEYKYLYNQVWTDVPHATFLNMDEQIKKDFYTGVVE